MAKLLNLQADSLKQREFKLISKQEIQKDNSIKNSPQRVKNFFTSTYNTKIEKTKLLSDFAKFKQAVSLLEDEHSALEVLTFF